MPNYSTTSATGVVNIVIEPSGYPGEQLLLAATPIVATITGFSAPIGSTGNRLHIKITGWDASGTFTVTGVGSPLNTETYTVAAPTTQQSQSPQLADFEIVTVNSYTSISNVTTTGITNGVMTVYGIVAGKFNLPCVIKSKRKPKTYSPNEHSGSISRNRKIVQLTNETTIDEIKQDVYANLSLWWAYTIMGDPIVTTIPATPSPIVTSVPITGATSTLTIATPPLAPQQKLIFNVTAFTTAGTMTILGTSGGVAGVTEVVSLTAVGTFYSSNAYSVITSITNATSALTLSVTAVFGWSLAFSSESKKRTMAAEWFDGVGSWTHPFCFFTDASFDIKVQTEASITVKGIAQDKLAIGDRTTTPLGGNNRIASLGLNLDDLPIVGWQTAVFVDAITGTPATTSYGDLQELKIDIKTPDEAAYTFSNSQNFNRAYAGKRECDIEMLIDFVDMYEYEQMRQQLKQYLNFQFIGQRIGTVAGVTYCKSWTWTIPMRGAGDFEVTSDPSKALVTAKALFQAEYDAALASSYKLVVVTTTPPTYAL